MQIGMLFKTDIVNENRPLITFPELKIISSSLAEGGDNFSCAAHDIIKVD